MHVIITGDVRRVGSRGRWHVACIRREGRGRRVHFSVAVSGAQDAQDARLRAAARVTRDMHTRGYRDTLQVVVS